MQIPLVDLKAQYQAISRFGAVTMPHIDWIEPLHLECEDFVNAIRTGAQPRAHGAVGVKVVRVLEAVQNVLEVQEKQKTAVPSGRLV